MEYAKDIILKIRYQNNTEKIKEKVKDWTSSIIKMVKENKFILSILTITSILIISDFVLVSNFIDLMITL